MKNNKPVVIVSPLNWGLGHATRCIPVISALLQNNCKPVICGNGNSFEILKNEFPDLKHVEMPSYTVTYSKNHKFFTLKILFNIPKFIFSMLRDKIYIDRLVKQLKPIAIISDNRYGVRHKSVYSVLITHQIKPVLPKSVSFTGKLFYNILFSWLKKFNVVWVPDFETENNLSGKLSHNTGFNEKKIKYCGILSRFNKNQHKIEGNPLKYDLTAIVSGPEPQRTLFEKYCLSLARNTNKKICIIAGKPDENISYVENNFCYHSHLKTEEFIKYLEQSEIVISLSGYTTIMDMFRLDKKTILVPTPHQTEQEYLAEYNSKKDLFISFYPAKDDLDESIEKLKRKNHCPIIEDTDILHRLVSETIRDIQFNNGVL